MAEQTPASRQWRIALADLFELKLKVRSADNARLQTIIGLLPPLALAIGLRLYGLFRFPFLHDELRLTEGLDGIKGIGPMAGQLGDWPQSLIFGAPLGGGLQNITPLWWWLAFAFRRLLPGPDELILRLPHLLIGLSGIILVWWLARQIFAPPVPALLTWLLAVHDIYLWTTTKAQFPDVVFVPLGVIVAYALIVARGRWGAFVAAGLAWGVATGYLLVKGVTFGAAAVAVGVAQVAVEAIRRRGEAADLADLSDGGRFFSAIRSISGLLLRRAVVVVLVALPIAVWLIGAQRFINAHYQVRVGDLGYYQRIIDLLYDLTIGFGVTVKRDLVGPPRTALLYYTHADAWPTTTFLAPFVVAGIGLAIATLGRDWRERSTRWHLALYIVVTIALGLTPILIKGAAGERYHLIYFPAALLAAGWVVERLWSAVIGKWGIVVGLVGLWVGVHLSWANWLAWDWRPGAPLVVVAALGLLAGGGYWLTRSVVARRLIVLGVFSAGIILSLIRGPLDWGLTAPYSPEPYNGILQKVELKYHP